MGAPHAPHELRFWFNVDINGPVAPGQSTPCWTWMRSRLNAGYGCAWFNGRQDLAHRVAWTLVFGPIPSGLFVCHRCDVRWCCNPDHLFLGTLQDNTADMLAKGRSASGEDNHGARLTKMEVLEIAALWKLGFRTLEIAIVYGVSVDCVRRIGFRRSWRRLLLPIDAGHAVP
jgi:hypothetical protein